MIQIISRILIILYLIYCMIFSSYALIVNLKIEHLFEQISSVIGLFLLLILFILIIVGILLLIAALFYWLLTGNWLFDQIIAI